MSMQVVVCICNHDDLGSCFAITIYSHRISEIIWVFTIKYIQIWSKTIESNIFKYHYIILYYIILYCIVLYYSLLYCIILHYIILYCIILLLSLLCIQIYTTRQGCSKFSSTGWRWGGCPRGSESWIWVHWQPSFVISALGLSLQAPGGEDAPAADAPAADAPAADAPAADAPAADAAADAPAADAPAADAPAEPSADAGAADATAPASDAAAEASAEMPAASVTVPVEKVAAPRIGLKYDWSLNLKGSASGITWKIVKDAEQPYWGELNMDAIVNTVTKLCTAVQFLMVVPCCSTQGSHCCTTITCCVHRGYGRLGLKS